MNTSSSDRIYTQYHVWILPQDEQEYVLGITQFAQEELGDIVFVDLPELGLQTQVDEACLVVESVKSASDVICPVQGEVIQINEALIDEPELINESPYEQGWIVRIKGQQSSEIKGNMTQDQYNSYVSGSSKQTES